jgi:hypothetical protein
MRVGSTPRLVSWFIYPREAIPALPEARVHISYCFINKLLLSPYQARSSSQTNVISLVNQWGSKHPDKPDRPSSPFACSAINDYKETLFRRVTENLSATYSLTHTEPCRPVCKLSSKSVSHKSRHRSSSLKPLIPSCHFNAAGLSTALTCGQPGTWKVLVVDEHPKALLESVYLFDILHMNITGKPERSRSLCDLAII